MADRTPESHEQRFATAMQRLIAAGLSPQAAEKVARHPSWGPVILGPGVIISLFELRSDGTSVLSPPKVAAS